MIMEIHSKYGKLTAIPLEVQAIEDSIPEGEICDNTELSKVADDIADD